MRRLLDKCVAITLSLSLLLLTSCQSETDKELKRELDLLSNYISDNLSNESIKLNKASYSEDGIYVELYGSKSSDDIEELILTCEGFADEYSDLMMFNGDYNIQIQLYDVEPDQDLYETLGYAVYIGNFSWALGTNERSKCFDCIDINLCDTFATSFFRQTHTDYRIIMLPSNTVIDDIEVFMGMNNLQSITISDYPYKADSERLNDKYEELLALVSEYDDVGFRCGYY